ncbi:hypothetical protein HBN50_01105 [Halobacteriovorax sp. GB3]|uniref:hypothetical protein n=1 Tax=Halobacteriovorax sp. GB3 TaxID=2719615 RepID=UPI0023604421|nr:hypothetical protein [Halobacteriovorax sp. GB3]MDD0851665.1 hypothetical protein [Halobacteriovorax sp. GB3]
MTFNRLNSLFFFIILVVQIGIIFFQYHEPINGTFPKYLVFNEDGFVELLTFFLLLISSFIMLSQSVKVKGALFFFCVTFFWALEEVSWGQWLIEFHTPNFFSTWNVQRELNFHNLIFPFFDLGLFLALSFFIYMKWRLRYKGDEIKYLWLSKKQVLYIIVSITLVIISQELTYYQFRFSANRWGNPMEEVSELLLALFVLNYALFYVKSNFRLTRNTSIL